MEVPRLGVQLELLLPVYGRATATPDLSRICNLHHSSRQRRILNPLSKARDQTYILMDASQIRFLCTTVGTPLSPSFLTHLKCHLYLGRNGFCKLLFIYLFIYLFFIFPLYSKGVRLSLHVYITITFFPPPFVLLQHEYLDIVLMNFLLFKG